MSRRVRRLVRDLEPKAEDVEPKIIVPINEYEREVEEIKAIKEKRKKLWSEAMRNLSFWRWRREPRYLDEYRRIRRRISRLNREESELREFLRRKVIKPYWIVECSYQFQKTTREPPYHFYAEFRKFVYTREPEKYAIWSKKEMKFTDPQPFLEEELRVVMFASSIMSRKRDDGTIAHGEWLEALKDIKVLPFPNFRAQAVDESEVDAPLDTQQYYVRIEEEGFVHEYKTDDVEYWLRKYREWLYKMYRMGIIRDPEKFDRAVRRTSIDEFVRRFRELRWK